MKGDSLEGLVGSSAIAHESRHADNFEGGNLPYNSPGTANTLPKKGLMERLRGIASSTYGKIAKGFLTGAMALAIYEVGSHAMMRKAEADEFYKIENIKQFLDTCPHSDPYFQTEGHLEVRRDGVRVPLEDVYCSEPVSQMPNDKFREELAAYQAIRAAAKFDSGQTGHLPWTDGTFHDWLIDSNIGGINVTQLPAGAYGACCETFDGNKYIDLKIFDDSEKERHKKGWDAISGLVSMIGHANGSPHVTCNNTLTMDQTFDDKTPSAWSADYVIGRLFLTEMNVGADCMEEGLDKKIMFDNQYGLVYQAILHFCENPPELFPFPQKPSGYCEGGTVTGTVTDESGSALEAIVKAVDPVNDNRVYATVFSKPDGTFKIERPGKGAGDFRFRANADECYLEKWYSASSGTADIVTVMDKQTVPLTGIRLDANDNIAGPSVQGAQNGIKGQSYSYTAVRSSSSANPVKYKFVWGDGTSTEWQAENDASHAYSSTGNYPVTALTKCELHGIESKVGEPLQVSIANPSGPDLTGKFGNVSSSCKSKKGVQQCTLYGIFTVENTGNQPSQPSNVRFYFSNDAAYDELGDVILKQLNLKKGLSPGAEKVLKLKFKFPAGVKPEEGYVLAVMNEGDKVVIYRAQ